ncbi:MAG: hypothetical protein HOP17_04000, partial [Acidobacteria bacterium]|nr:hypothetical protein [Acidobacteriota bacterium]
MEKQQKQSYLFLLQRPSSTARYEAAKRLRELGMRVVAQFGDVAIEAFTTDSQLEAAREMGLFSAQLRGPMSKDHLEKLNSDQRSVVQQWNTRFSSGYRKLKKDLTHVGKSWADPGMDSLVGYTAIDPEDLFQLIREYQDKTGEKLAEPPSAKERTAKVKRMSGKEFVDFEKRLGEAYKNPTLAYHLARLAYRLDPKYHKLLFNLPDWLIAELLDRFFGEVSCWKMTGEMSVGIVFVESSLSGGPKFGASERNEILQEIYDGFSFLTQEHPDGNLSWVYDTQYVKINVADGTGDPQEDYWRDPGMGQVNYFGTTYTANWSGVGAYREDIRQRNRSAHAIVVFVTPYRNWWHAYASGGRLTLAKRNDWGNW